MSIRFINIISYNVISWNCTKFNKSCFKARAVSIPFFPTEFKWLMMSPGLYLLTVVIIGPVLASASYNNVSKDQVIIAGLFAYNLSEVAPDRLHMDRTANGSVVELAVNMALSEYNESPFSQLRLTLWPYSTECDPARAVWSLTDALRRTDRSEPLVILGPPCEDSTNELVRLTSSSTNILTVSYASTTPQLNNATIFRNFFRTVPSFTNLNDALINLLGYFSWENVCLILESHPYYNTAAEALSAMNLTIVESIPPALLQYITTNSYCHIFLVYSQPEYLPNILCQAYNNRLIGQYYQWIFVGNTEISDLTAEVDSINCSSQELLTAAQSSFVIGFDDDANNDDPLVGISRSKFNNSLLNVSGVSATSNDLSVAASAYDAMWAIAISLNNSVNRLKERNQTINDYLPLANKDVSATLFNEFQSVNFRGVSTMVNFTTMTHNTLKPIKISQVHQNSLVAIGLYKTDTKLNMDYFGHQVQWIGDGPPRDSPVFINESVPLWAQIIMFTVSGIGALVLSFFLVINLCFREKKVIKASSPHINTLILVGCLLGILSVSVYTLSSIESIVTDIRSIFCNSTLWLVNIMFTLSFGALLAKTWRVGAVFRNPWSKRRIYKDYVLFLIVLVLLAVDVLILTVWMLTSPLYISVRMIQSPSAITELSFCSLSGEGVFFGILLMVYKSFLLLLGCFLATQTRGIKATLFNDSRFIAIAIYIVFLIVIIGLPMAIFFLLGRYILLSFFAITLTITGLSFT
ncbi:PREDICTED: gamma-aminobutyric acid type B receptor subunit 2-like, partial [Amphimedon queenslandica]|uniref:G-protein coupled receptors family 3 profile domain-containing protein n=1 Tax=Amphimedon queenslandica TaxID=400682 RepID=A0AAN0J590_AMPQE